jgi:hypothetical protein
MKTFYIEKSTDTLNGPKVIIGAATNNKYETYGVRIIKSESLRNSISDKNDGVEEFDTEAELLARLEPFIFMTENAKTIHNFLNDRREYLKGKA